MHRAGGRAGAGVVVVVAEDGEGAELAVQRGECARVGPRRLVAHVEQVAGEDDDVGSERGRLAGDGRHALLGHEHPGVDVRELQDGQAVEVRVQAGQHHVAPGDERRRLRGADSRGGRSDRAAEQAGGRPRQEDAARLRERGQPEVFGGGRVRRRLRLVRYSLCDTEKNSQDEQDRQRQHEGGHQRLRQPAQHGGHVGARLAGEEDADDAGEHHELREQDEAPPPRVLGEPGREDLAQHQEQAKLRSKENRERSNRPEQLQEEHAAMLPPRQTPGRVFQRRCSQYQWSG